MAAVVAVMAQGRRFADALLGCWESGDAVLPLDPRLPPPAARRLLDSLAPTHLIDEIGERVTLEGGRPTEGGDALVVPTSATTGRAKGVVLTHDAVEASARATSARLGVDPSRDRWLACLPLAHVGGLSVLTRSLFTGTPVDISDGFDADVVARSDATLVSLVPTALRRIDPTRWRTIVLGGSAPPAHLPANVVVTYGMTETGSGIVYDGVPLDGVGVRIDAGEICLSGPMLLRTYRDGSVPLRDGWLRTGDLGALDAGGRLTVHGRRDDLVVTGGENVWPEPVERRLAAHPGVAAAAVVGRPDPEWGQTVEAVVVAAAGVEPPTLEALRSWVRDELGVWCAPRHLRLVDRLPVTSLGKLRRPALRGPAGHDADAGGDPLSRTGP